MKKNHQYKPQPVFAADSTLSIGIAAPSAVPFAVGGAEKLWWGLQEYINRNTTHHCELIKLCAPEDNFRDLVTSYSRFYHLDLLHFDILLSTKYPAWMVRHPNHHIYLQHPLRGLYELYPGPETLPPKAADHPKVARVLRALEEAPNGSPCDSPDAPLRILDRCLDLAHDPSAPEEALALPGPLLRRIVRVLDHGAIRRAVRVSAISRTVRSRPGYFPDPAAVGVIYHPSNLNRQPNPNEPPTGPPNGAPEYLLAASRLVHAKRIHLILAAYLKSGLDIPLKIAGRGPERPFLEKMAAGNENIHFTGFVSDHDLARLYSDALAVVFIPENEDLGLITLEAMGAAKPVITCTDSGGSTELVRHGETGWICAPTEKDLARAMQAAAFDPEKTANMGGKAQEAVAGVTWENLFSALFAPAPAPANPDESPEPVHTPQSSRPNARTAGVRRSGRPRLSVFSTFPVHPPRGGGQTRIYHLYRGVTRDFDVHMVSLGPANQRAGTTRIAPGFTETRLPMPHSFLKKARALGERLGASAVDIAVCLYPEMLPDFAAAVSKAAVQSDLAVFSHPYTLALAGDYARGKGIYEAHNVEYDIKKAVLKEKTRTESVLRRVRAVEQAACDASVLTMACSQSDIDRLRALYGLDPARALLVPNGVDTSACAFTPPDQRAALKQAWGLEHTRLAVFMGSYHPPNIRAVEEILGFAGRLPDWRFVIIGSVANHFKERLHPDNVGFAGEIAATEKAFYLSCADAALNPMDTGSGTNLKMLEYIASGLPVISTHFGARGLEISDMPVIVKPVSEFPAALEAFDPLAAGLSARVRFGRAMIDKNFCWEAIAGIFSEKIKKKLSVS